MDQRNNRRRIHCEGCVIATKRMFVLCQPEVEPKRLRPMYLPPGCEPEPEPSPLEVADVVPLTPLTDADLEACIE